MDKKTQEILKKVKEELENQEKKRKEKGIIDDETSLNLNWREKLMIKVSLNKAKKKIKSARNDIYDIREKLGKELADSDEKLVKGKKEIIEMIVGSKNIQMPGLIDIFDVTDETGNIITKENLEKMEIDDVIDLFEQLVEALRKEI